MKGSVSDRKLNGLKQSLCFLGVGKQGLCNTHRWGDTVTEDTKAFESTQKKMCILREMSFGCLLCLQIAYVIFFFPPIKMRELC